MRFNATLHVMLMFGAAASAAQADIIFVRANQVLPVGFQTGGSWALAYKDLQTALADAVAGDEIWVGAGTYKPTTSASRSATFTLKQNVDMFGGFAGFEASIGERDTVANPTILSGNIGAVGDSDNSFHVVTAPANITTATLVDGFVIRDGHANGGGNDNLGAGLRMSSGTPNISRCLFVDNRAAVFGAAVFGNGGASNGVFRHCVFLGNSSDFGSGGAVRFESATSTLANCTIAHNTGGGFAALNAPSIIVRNSILFGNTGNDATLDDQLKQTNSTLTASSCCIEAIAAPFLGSGNIGLDPKFLDIDGVNDVLGDSDYNLRLRGDSPCIDAASVNFIGSDTPDFDDDGNTAETDPLDADCLERRVEDLLTSNSGVGPSPFVDMGAYEHARPRTVLVDHSATGANNGSSWQDAYTDLQFALSELGDVKSGEPGEIWVADGAYTPSFPGGGTVNSTFSLLTGVTILGGFEGGERSRSARNPLVNETILSGDLPPAGPAGNTTRVVTASFFVDETAVLDGFVIRDGNAGLTSTQGGGVLITNDASPTIRNCRITANSGIDGSGVLVDQGGAAVLINCEVFGNSGGNAAVRAKNNDVPFALINCTVFGNTGSSVTAGVSAITADVALTNCAVYLNTAVGGATGQLAQLGEFFGGDIVVNFCAIQGWDGTHAGVGSFNGGTNPGVTNPIGPDGVIGTGDENLDPFNCGQIVDAGTTSGFPLDVNDLDDDGTTNETLPFDISGSLRRVDAPRDDTGSGGAPLPDIGAREFDNPFFPSPDINGDGEVDGADFGLLLAAWAAINSPADLNQDCTVDGADLGLLLADWTG